MPAYYDDPTLLEQFFDILSPYLPSQISRPLYSVMSSLNPTELINNPSSLIPLLLSLFAIYTTVLSMYNTTRFAFRFTWFLLKWSSLIGLLGVGWNGYNNGWKGTSDSLNTMGKLGNQVYRVGRSGVGWWLGSDQASGSRPRRSTRQTRPSKNDKRSANGRPKTWSTMNDDGDWDDPEEIDLATLEKNNQFWKSAQESLLSFLGSSTPNTQQRKQPKAKSSSGEKLKKPNLKQKKRNENEGNGMGWAAKFAMNQAKRMWDDTTGANDQGSSRKPRRNR